MVKFDACVGCCEVPTGFGVGGIAVVLPGGDFVDEGLFVGDAAVERTVDDRTPSSDFAEYQAGAVFGGSAIRTASTSRLASVAGNASESEALA